MQSLRPKTLQLCMGLLSSILGACGGASQGAAPAASTTSEASAPAAATEGAETANTTPTPAQASPAIDTATASTARSPENRARDAFRHPKETLGFFGIEPGMRVIELAPGGGWYTEILASIACQAGAEGGALIATLPDPQGPGAKYGKVFTDRLATSPEHFSCVETVVFEPPKYESLGPDSSADMVLTFRSTHNWIARSQAEAVYKAAFAVLKPGGVLGVVQHRADDGEDPAAAAKKGYVPESYVVQLAQNAGFELAGSSDINRNPRDTHDHPEGVWTLPPVLRLGDQDREKYLAIGESDRMTLKFVKPARDS